jgi:hypothetical protein
MLATPSTSLRMAWRIDAEVADPGPEIIPGTRIPTLPNCNARERHRRGERGNFKERNTYS